MRALLLLGAFLLAPPARAEESFADVLVRPVPRGTLLVAEDFERRAVPTSQVRMAVRALDAIGQEARRALAAGMTLRAGDIGPAALVRRGEEVRLHVVAGALRISARGRALDDGGRGARVRVVNLATARTLEGRVLGAGQVGIAAP